MDSKRILIGIVSQGRGCLENAPVIYTSVARKLRFNEIQQSN
jgi:hypothetical protein